MIVLSFKRVLVQLLKFGVSGIVGVVVSTILFYGFKGNLPYYGWGFWFIIQRNVDLVNLAFYELTTIIGGTAHFMLSKVWVFKK